MKKSLLIVLIVFVHTVYVSAQVEPNAGTWRPWFDQQVKPPRLPSPPSNKEELSEVISAQRALESKGMNQIMYWSAGAPGYRWYNLASKLWMTDITGSGALAQMLMGTAIYDATVAAWDTKYAYQRQRPYLADSKIKLLVAKPESP